MQEDLGYSNKVFSQDVDQYAAGREYPKKQ